MQSRLFFLVACLGGSSALSSPVAAQHKILDSRTDAEQASISWIAPRSTLVDQTAFTLAQAVPSGDARRDASGVDRGNDQGSAGGEGAGPKTSPVVGNSAVESRKTDDSSPKKDSGSNAGFEEVAPHYAFDIEAPDALRALIERQTSLGKWRRRREYDSDQFEALLANLKPEVEAICRAHGYFDCVIEVSGEASRAKLKVTTGSRATVREARVELQGDIENRPDLSERLLLAWGMPVGQHYEAANWEDSKRKLLAGLQQNGYLRADIVDSNATVDVQDSSAVLHVTVRSGPQIRFGELKVTGLERYPRKLIDGLRPFREGADYNYDLLQRFQSNLRDSGYFRNAYVTPDVDALEADPQATAIPLKLDLTEEQVKRATYGIGYGTDAGARLILGLEHRNLFGRGDRMDSGVIFEQKRQRAFIGVRTPSEPSGHYWAYGGRFDRLDVSGQKTGTTTLYGGRGKQSGRIDTFTSLAHQSESQAIDLGDGNTAYEHARATVLGFSWNYRALDSRIDPREGLSISAQASGAVKGLITDTTFLRLYTRTYYFWPLDRELPNKAGVFVGRLELGQVFASTTQGIPSTNLFRAGGSQSLRGYDFNTIGLDRGTAVVGGRVLGVASVEYQHPITDAVWGAAFVDVGGAALSWGDFRTYRSYGLGLRLRTPVGPINLDAAYADNDRRFRFQFSVGFLF